MLAGIQGGSLPAIDSTSTIPSAMQVSNLPVKIDGARPIDGDASLEAFPRSLDKGDVMEAQRELGQVSSAIDYAKDYKSIRDKIRAKKAEFHSLVLDDREDEMKTALSMTKRQAKFAQKTQRFAYQVKLEQQFVGGYQDPMTNPFSFA